MNCCAQLRFIAGAATACLGFGVASAYPVTPQGGPIRAVARELSEALAQHIGKSSGKLALKEIAELGGEAALREVGERVVREGGEASLDTLLRFTKVYGKEALKAVQHSVSSPRLLSALDELPADALGPAIRRLASPNVGKQLAEAVEQLGSQVLICEVRHPGIGGQIVSTLGSTVSPLIQGATRDQAVLVARYADEVAALSEPGRAMVTEMIAKQFNGFTSFLGKFASKNPKAVLFTGASLIALESQAERILGGDEILLDEDGRPIVVQKPGLVRTSLDSVSRNLAEPAASVGRNLALAVGLPVGIGLAVLIARRRRPNTRSRVSSSKAHTKVQRSQVD